MRKLIKWLLLILSLHTYAHLSADLIKFSHEELAPIAHNGRYSPFSAFLYQNGNSLDSLYTLIQAHFSEPQNDDLYLMKIQLLKEQGLSSREMAEQLNLQFPLVNRLQQSSDSLRMLPGKFRPGEWYSLKSLKLQLFDPVLGELKPVSNFTLYPNALFKQIQSQYLALEQLILQQPTISLSQIQTAWQTLMESLMTGYQTIAGKPFQFAATDSLSYPTLFQLEMENLYFTYPWLEAAALFYLFAVLATVLSFSLHSIILQKIGSGLIISAFILHTSLLIMRIVILGRPPVSNMEETILYVPWVAILLIMTTLFLQLRQLKQKKILILLPFSAALIGAFFLWLLKTTQLNQSLHHVQAVLNSHYWLVIHVLMIVGSYGVFIAAGVLSHLYLLQECRSVQPSYLETIEKWISQFLYMGTALLIPGTLLGGVWAAESWGRFWDWDPKESWAFISICTYLIIIHAYRFKKIKGFGLAVGSIAGLQVITFTWYGVNYLLGTGLHSYGFGSGGNGYYYLFIILETLFLGGATYLIKKRKILLPF